MINTQFQVRKDDFVVNRLVETEPSTVAVKNGEILLQIENFAYTANNVTYAVAGDMIGYWQFYPPIGKEATGWGVIPVWGFARIIQSSMTELAVGERIFGYFPPASFVTMKPKGVTNETFIDGTEHRTPLRAVYNLYRRVDREARYNAALDKERMLLFPLHLTAFCLWDSLQDNGYYGAEQLIILSASSKTSIGFGYALSANGRSPYAIGMTSQRNLETVQQLNVYDKTVTYDAVADLDASRATVIVDMSGNTTVLAALHNHLGNNMKFTSKVGLTHWDHNEQQKDIIIERSGWFFAPTHIQKRMEEWGPGVFNQKSTHFLTDTAAKTKEWLTFKTISGLEGLTAIHANVCNGVLPPEEGLIVEL